MTCPLCGGPEPAQCRCAAACFMCGQEHPHGTECPQRTECERYGHIFYSADSGRPAATCQRIGGCAAQNPRYEAWAKQFYGGS